MVAFPLAPRRCEHHFPWMATITDVRHHALRALIPPPRLHLSDWIEGEIAVALMGIRRSPEFQ